LFGRLSFTRSTTPSGSANASSRNCRGLTPSASRPVKREFVRSIVWIGDAEAGRK